MTNRTRYFVITSLLVLAIGVGTGLLAYYVGVPGGLRSAATAPMSSSTSPGTPPSSPTWMFRKS